MVFYLIMKAGDAEKLLLLEKLSRAVCTLLWDLHVPGNLNAQRDWGHAKDYVRMQWLMLQQEQPNDYVIATASNTQLESFYCGHLRHLAWKLSLRECLNEVGTVKALIAKKPLRLLAKQL